MRSLYSLTEHTFVHFHQRVFCYPSRTSHRPLRDYFRAKIETHVIQNKMADITTSEKRKREKLSKEGDETGKTSESDEDIGPKKCKLFKLAVLRQVK